MKIFPLFACLATIASSLAGATCAEIGDKAEFKPIEFDALETVIEHHITPLPPTFPEHAILFLEGVIQSKHWNDTDRAALKQSIAELKKLNEGLPGRDDVEACIERDPEIREPLEPLTAKEVASFEKAMGVSLDTLQEFQLKEAFSVIVPFSQIMISKRQFLGFA